MREMPTRVNRQEVVELINSIEAAGRDASELRAALATFPAPQPRRQGSRFREEEELTTAEYLSIRVGDLFPKGITDNVLAQLIEMDRNHSLKELLAMCREAGLGTGGDKKVLASKLLASGRLTSKTEEAKMASQEYVNLKESREWTGKPGQYFGNLVLPQAYLKPLHYEIVVFVKKERGGHDFSFQCKDYEYTPKHGWRFEHVIIDSSIKDQDQVKLAKLSYHPEVMLVNLGFLVLPIPEGVDSSSDS